MQRNNFQFLLNAAILLLAALAAIEAAFHHFALNALLYKFISFYNFIFSMIYHFPSMANCGILNVNEFSSKYKKKRSLAAISALREQATAIYFNFFCILPYMQGECPLSNMQSVKYAKSKT